MILAETRKPSWKTGFARNASVSAYPRLWKGLIGAWSPNLGPTGLTLFDQSINKNNGTLTNMDAVTDWIVDERGYALDFDGTNDYINVGKNSFDLGIRRHATFSTWFRSNTSNANRSLMGDWNSSVGFSIRIDDDEAVTFFCVSE